MKLIYDLILQSLKAQEAALSDLEDKDDMDITDGGKSWFSRMLSNLWTTGRYVTVDVLNNR